MKKTLFCNTLNSNIIFLLRHDTRFLDSFQKKWRLFTVKEIWHFAQKIHATVHTYLVTMHIYEEKMQTKIQLYTLIHIKFWVYTKPQERNVSLFIIPRLPLQLYVKSLSWSRAMLHLGQHFDYHHRCVRWRQKLTRAFFIKYKKFGCAITHWYIGNWMA